MIHLVLAIIGSALTLVGVIGNLTPALDAHLTWLETFYCAALTYIIVFKKEESF